MSNATSTIDNYLQVVAEKQAKVNDELLLILRSAKDECEDEGLLEYNLRLHGNKRNDRNEMYRNKIEDPEVEILCLSLTRNTFITGLDLGYNLINDQGAETLGRFLQETVGLCSLVLSYNDIGEKGATALAKGIQENETLKVLKLDGNKCGTYGGLSLAGALQVNMTLQELNLCNTDQSTQSVVAFTTVLRQNSPIKVFDMSRPLLYSQQEETTVHIAKMLEVNTKLEELHLSKHEMKNFGVEQLMGHLYDNIFLKRLNLSCNTISRDGIKCIADYLKTNPSMQLLNLAYNRAEDDGAIYLSEALAIGNSTLMTLVMCGNSLTGTGLCALAKCLYSNLTLRQLYIWGNNIDASASQICDVLQEKGTSQDVNVKNQAFLDLTQSKFPRLLEEDTDVRAYVVDDVPYLARVSSPY